MAKLRDDFWVPGARIFEWAFYLLLAALVIIVLVSCRTYDTVVNAPEVFWTTAARIVEAFLNDIVDIVRLFL